jgi:hypothetical protein
MVIRLHIQEPGADDANQTGAAVPSNFTSLGEATNAVMLRLSTKLPRIKVRGRLGEESKSPSR